MLVGVLGGPVGLLLGWGAGAMMGSAFDLDRAATSDEALTVLGRPIPPGSSVDSAGGGCGDRRVEIRDPKGRRVVRRCLTRH
jgi:hypothetical protein